MAEGDFVRTPYWLPTTANQHLAGRLATVADGATVIVQEVRASVIGYREPTSHGLPTVSIAALPAASGFGLPTVTLTNPAAAPLATVAVGTWLDASAKAEDAAHASGDPGAFVLAVRNDSDAARTSADGDYSPLSTDSAGRLKTADAALATRVDEASATLTYVGAAAPGTAAAAAAWQVKRIDTSAGTVILYADGDSLFDNVWTDRATLSYS